jgi:hypothetical protein
MDALGMGTSYAAAAQRGAAAAAAAAAQSRTQSCNEP